MNDGVLFLWYVKQTRKTDFLDRVVDTDQKISWYLSRHFPVDLYGKTRRVSNPHYIESEKRTQNEGRTEQAPSQFIKNKKSYDLMDTID